MIKKITACLLIAVMCVCCLCACGDKDDAPDGMYSVSLEGEPFILYVPGSWSDNRDSGISSAYYSINNAVTVSARYFTPDGEVTLSDYVNAAEESYAESFTDYKRAERNEASLLGEKTAVMLKYTFNKGSDNITVTQYYAEQGKGESRIIIMLSIYYATAGYSEEYGEMFAQIVDEFRFREPAPVSDEKVDKDTPDGMKIASFDNAEYVFYVPKSWVCNSADKLTAAYYPESGRPNVSVISFAPESEMTAKEFFEASEEIYKTDIAGYERISESNIKLSGRDAVSYEYKAVYGSAEYRIRQTVAVYGSLIYSVTYTALADSYDAHIADVEAMISAFRFR